MREEDYSLQDIKLELFKCSLDHSIQVCTIHLILLEALQTFKCKSRQNEGRVGDRGVHRIFLRGAKILRTQSAPMYFASPHLRIFRPSKMLRGEGEFQGGGSPLLNCLGVGQRLPYARQKELSLF